jgi:D-alanyl-lipoteichoic acid acyltransferase DltB (MBOAT superfamily)
VRHTTVIFLVSGLWHGANWTFVAWGAVHALLFLPLLLLGRNRRNTGDLDGWPSLRELTGIATTFAAVCIAWVFFRADSLAHAGEYLAGLGRMHSEVEPSSRMLIAALVLPLTLGVDWLATGAHFDRSRVWQAPTFRWTVYFVACAMILLSWSDESTQFIYFQF